MTTSTSESNSLNSPFVEEFYTAPTTPAYSVYSTPISSLDTKKSTVDAKALQCKFTRETTVNPTLEKYRDSILRDNIQNPNTLRLTERYVDNAYNRYESIVKLNSRDNPSPFIPDIQDVYSFSETCRNKVSLPGLLDPPFTRKSQTYLEELDLDLPLNAVVYDHSEFLHLLPSVNVLTKAKHVLDTDYIMSYPVSQKNAPIPKATLDAALKVLSGEKNPFNTIQKIKNLGDGSYGSVDLFKTPDGKTYAIKTFYENSKGDINQISFDEEYRKLSLISHENVVKLIHVDAPNHRLFLEFVEKGPLTNSLPSERIVKALSQVAKTLADMHLDQHAIHGDLKLANILIDSEDNIKLADLGLSFFKDEFDRIKEEMTPSFKSYLPYYLPPELKEEGLTPKNCEKIDVWSFGILIWEFLKKENAIPSHIDIDFTNGSWRQDKIFTGFNETLLRSKLDPNKIASIDPAGHLTVFMIRCLDVNPDNRPSMNEIALYFSNLPTDPNDSAVASSESSPVMSRKK